MQKQSFEYNSGRQFIENVLMIFHETEAPTLAYFQANRIRIGLFSLYANYEIFSGFVKDWLNLEIHCFCLMKNGKAQ
jgi:hypothetical protein